MGTYTSAKLFYGVPLPDDTNLETDWEEQLYDMGESGLSTGGVKAVWTGWEKGGTDYLTAVSYDVDLGNPEPVDLSDTGPDVREMWDERLRDIWQALNLPLGEMPEPVWILSSNSS